MTNHTPEDARERGNRSKTVFLAPNVEKSSVAAVDNHKAKCIRCGKVMNVPQSFAGLCYDCSE